MTSPRKTPIGISGDAFRTMGHQLIDTLAAFIDTIGDKPVTRGETPAQIRAYIPKMPLPQQGTAPAVLLENTTKVLLDHSLFNGHPKFLGYITSSPAPLGALADLLAAVVNPNVGANILSPVATEIEKQTVQWLAELIGLPPTFGGLLVSGGNMANLTAFMAARTAKAPRDVKQAGLSSMPTDLTIYCSKATHTWIEKAASLFGLGTNAIRWIATTAQQKMDNDALEKAIQNDVRNGYQPMMVVGTAGDVSTGAVDDLNAIAAICNTYGLWFHIDGAYGAPAAAVPELTPLFEGLAAADSIALDPHKWLYSPLEAGCTLVKNARHLTDAYSAHPDYYNFDANGEEQSVNFYEYGFQNSRGFRALKVWMTLQQVGRAGYVDMFRQDMALSRMLYQRAVDHPELEAISQSLSIATFRYAPAGITDETYLNELNKLLLNQLQAGGKAFLSNAIVRGKYCLRGCIVNFRTTEADIAEIIDIVVSEGRTVHSAQLARQS